MKEIVVFSPEYWWREGVGKDLCGKREEIERWGGLGRVCSNVYERLPTYGYHVSILARRRGGIYLESFYEKRNVIHYTPVRGVDVYGIPPCTNLGVRIQPKCETFYRNTDFDNIINWDHIFTALNYVLDYNDGGLRDVLYDERTLLHVHDWFGGAWVYNLKTARKLPDMKSILSVHMSSERNEDMVEKDERLQWELKGCKLADKVHAVSRYQTNLLREKYRVRSDKLVYIPNGVDTEYFRPSRNREEEKEDEEILSEYGIKPKEYILFYGRIDRVKGVHELIRAYKKLSPELDLCVFGLPADWNYYHILLTERENSPEKIKDKIKIHVQPLPARKLVGIIRSAHTAVFPSLQEAFGLVAVEAQACGIPVVVGNVGGLPENVKNYETGVIVNSFDPSSIAKGIEYVLSNREELARGVRKFAETYSWDNIVKRYVEELYKPLME